MTSRSPARRLLVILTFATLAVTLTTACSGGDSDGSPAASDCAGAKPWPDKATKGGLSQCENGIVHRSGTPSCTAAAAPDLAADDPAAQQCEGVPCTQQPGGFCVATLGSSPEQSSIACVYACESDADCAEDSACFCGAKGGECIPAGCRADADCGDEPCILMFGKLSCGVPTAPALTCRVPTRECSADLDCNAESFCIDGSCTPKVNTCG